MNRAIVCRWLARGLVLAVAVCSACRTPAEQAPDLHKQLTDASASVRAKAALTLAETNDAEAIPVLIDLLAVLSAEEGKTIEDYLTRLAGEWAPAFQDSGDNRTARKGRRDAWMKWWRSLDGSKLVGIVRQHTPTPELRRQIQKLLDQLGDDAFATREAAEKELHRLGRPALPQLRKAIASGDPEVARRAKMLIERLEHDPKSNLPAAVVRLLALRKPEGAAAALLAYLPSAEEENLGAEVQKALAALALGDGKLDGALLRALADERRLLRAAAAEALIEGGGGEGRAAVGKLLQEEGPTVRLRLALALARVGEREGVAVLIELLPLLSTEECAQAEEALYQLAGDSAPEMPRGADADAKNKRRDAWASWWKHNNRVDLSCLRAPALLGHTVICDNFGGRVFEIDRGGKERWSIRDLQIPIDAVVLSGNRVLIAEYQANRVAERDFKGKILWQKDIARPVNTQRLPNGHTFIATEKGPIVEVNRAGKELYSIPKVPGGLLAAYRRPGGDIVCKTADGQCRLLDIRGKQLKSFAAGHDPNSTGGLDAAANGHILITRQADGKVVEFDRDGKSALEFNAAIVGCASLTPNGHVLVPDYQNQRVYELDRAGKIVWEYKGNGHFIRARRR